VIQAFDALMVRRRDEIDAGISKPTLPLSVL
jgi:hypothetical protein